MNKKIFTISYICIALVLVFTINSYSEDNPNTDHAKRLLATTSELTFEYEEAFNQATFKPDAKDFFGIGANVTPIYRVEVKKDDEQRKNKVALTFDSAYINDFTYKILDILDKYDAKCTFFMTAEWAANNPEHVREISRRGHEIGNHTTTHPNLNRCNPNKIIEEVLTCHQLMKLIINQDMCLFRFPYGSYSQSAISILKNLGYYPIQWTFDSIDWKNEGREYLLHRFKFTDQIQEGSIILCHNGATYTPEVLDEIMQLIKSRGLDFVKVSDLIYRHNFYIQGGAQHSK